jgi:hypothetical protein
MSTPFPSAQAFEEMFEYSRRLAEAAGIDFLESILRERDAELEVPFETVGDGAHESPTTRVLRDECERRRDEHEGLVASVARAASWAAPAEAPTKMYHDSLNDLAGKRWKADDVGPGLQADIYESEYRKAAERQEALLAVLRRIAAENPQTRKTPPETGGDHPRAQSTPAL